MPGDSIRTLVMSAEKDAVKRFLSHMHQSWDQLHVEPRQVCAQCVLVIHPSIPSSIHPAIHPPMVVITVIGCLDVSL